MILTIGGKSENDIVANIDLYNIKGGNFKEHEGKHGSVELPFAISGTTGGLLQGRYPFTCGGLEQSTIDDKELAVKECFAFNFKEEHVVNVAATLQTPRAWAASAVTGPKQSMLFVVGGTETYQTE